MTKLFISHSSQDDAFVRELQQALGLHSVDAWIDSRELLPGGLLDPDIAKAINESSAFAVVVSPASLQSKWVGKELRHALDVQKQRGREKLPVFALSLDDTKLGVLEQFFDGEPLYIPARSGAGGVEAAINPILVALGKRLPSDTSAAPQPKAEPLKELVLELTDLKFHEEDGVRRASARARLVYEPATAGQEDVRSKEIWRFVAPLGPIEKEELRWYLEKYAIWPSEYFRDRARKVEENLVKWGQLLHTAALPVAHTANVLQAWARIDGHAGRRFSVHVDTALEAGVPAPEQEMAREVATLILGLPWELLHDGDGFLFQGAKPTRVRRRLPNTRVLDVPVVATPIRILLITARPEDEACGYIDHRASALPLVEAMEELGGLVRMHVLSPPTLPALREELDRARREAKPYHVVHFDGHGVYDRHVGLGGLCFEHPQDIGKLDQRRHITVNTDDLGPLLRDHRIPLVFLEACQTAQAEQASESVASELLKVGVASVVAMSHSVLVETARRFVAAFYDALARGARVGDALLDGQRKLKDDTFRGRIFGAGELRLEDWFVPVLFQEKDDPQLFRTTHARQTREDLKAALAAELARWMVRSYQIRRAAFVSVETHSHVKALLDALGRQLVPNYSVATFADLEKAILPVERTLAEQSTLLVVDNMESILLPPYIETPGALSEEARQELTAILKLCARLHAKGDTRLVFTSRESLPAPFDAERNRRELHQLAREDAVKLVERALNREEAGAGAAADAAREAIEQLVEAIHGHARTLALLAPALRSRGVEATHASLVELMAEMERKFPGSREKSVFASVELSLRRISPANRDKARVLGVFHGGVDLDVLCMMMQWEKADVASLAGELIETGLATPNRYNHLTLNPALCPYLRGRMDAAEREALTVRWAEAMRAYADFLVQQGNQNSEVAATLTVLELPNLFALLEQAQRAGDAEVTIDLATSLYSLLKNAGRPRLLERVACVGDAAAPALGETWNHARFEAQRTRIEQQLVGGRLR
ncbi:MAG: CHAT domain-containing protein, partial [Gammaproteobacteria bacterium]